MVVLSDCVTRNQKLRNNESSSPPPPPPPKKRGGRALIFPKMTAGFGWQFSFLTPNRNWKGKAENIHQKELLSCGPCNWKPCGQRPGVVGGTAEKQRTPPVHQKKQMKKRNVGVWVSIYFLFQLKTFDHLAQWNSLNFRFFFTKLLGD